MVMCLICCETSQSALKFEWLLSWCALVWHSGQFHWWEWELQWSKASNDFSCLNWTVCDLSILVLFFVLFWFCFGVLFSEKLALFISSILLLIPIFQNLFSIVLRKRISKAVLLRLCEGCSCTSLAVHFSPSVLYLFAQRAQRNHLKFFCYSNVTYQVSSALAFSLGSIGMMVPQNSPISYNGTCFSTCCRLKPSGSHPHMREEKQTSLVTFQSTFMRITAEDLFMYAYNSVCTSSQLSY